MTTTDRVHQLERENAALWKVVSALRKQISAEEKLFNRFRPSLVVEMSRKQWKKAKPLYEALYDQAEAAERDRNQALEELEAFEKGDVP